MSFARKHLLPLFLLALGVALIYSNSLDASFQFDDLQIRDRPNLRITTLNFQTLKGTLYWSPNQKRVYRPIPCLTLGLNFYFGRNNPFGYHIVNITIHILCAIALYVFLQTLLSIPGIKPAFAAKHRYEIVIIATFLFAFHPIQTNVATYIIQRMTSMAALFYVISVTGYISFRKQTAATQQGSSTRKYLSLSISILAGALSFLSKQNTAVLPVTILIVDYLFFYDTATAHEKEKLKRVYAITILILLALICYAGPKYYFSFLNRYDHRDFSLIQRLMTQPRVIFFYLYQLLIPGINHLNLNHDFVVSEGMINPPQTLIALAGLTIILVFAFILRKQHNLLSFVILWFLGNLVIESTIVPLELVYEHRTYLPGVLIFFLMSMGIVYLSVAIFKNKKAILLTSLLLILYGNGTYLRNYVFKTPISMWFDVVQKSPNLARAHGNLGKSYMDLGHNLEARRSFEKALELEPDFAEALVNLGKLYFERFGMKDEAMTLFKKAQRVTPGTVLGCMALGDAYFKLKNYQKAEHFYKVVLGRLRFYVPAINNLGIAKIHLGKNEEAMKLFQWGIRVQPAHEPFYLNLAKLHAKENRFSDAIDILKQYQVIDANPKEAKELLKAIEQKAHAATPAKG